MASQPRTSIGVLVKTRDKLEVVAKLNGFNRIATYLDWHATKEIKNKKK